MYLWLHNWLVAHGLARATPWLTLTLLAVFAVVVCFAARWLLRFLLVRLARGATLHLKHTSWAQVALDNKVPQQLGNLAVPIVISLVASGVPESLNILEKAAAVAAGIVSMLIFHALIDTAGTIYSRYEISKTRPLTGVFQITQAILFLLTIIVVLAVLMGQSPAVLIGGIGATVAVVSFVFKDPILGFVAGIQLTTGDLLRIGDWITVPNANADGDVIEITMITVRVQNFDRSITSVPAYKLVTSPFINWRSMAETGARRIKRAIYIDTAGVRLADDAMLRRFEGIGLLQGYMAGKRAALEKAGHKGNTGDSEPLNTRHLTNLGTFRAYMQAYLDAHPGLRHDMSVMVRQLDAGSSGIPLEVYAFTATADWAAYEGIQADIFDHFYSAAPRFGLSVYQAPSGRDIRSTGVAGTAGKDMRQL